jgi:endonuclease-3
MKKPATMPSVKDLLVQRGEKLLHAPPGRIAFTGNAVANDLLNDLQHYPHAFVLACVMDRQIKAELAWLIPHRFAQKLGDFEFSTLRALTLNDVRRLMTKPTPLHRFTEKMSVNFYGAVQRIANVYGGNASRIWSDEPPCYEVVARFRQFDGIGPKIAAMAVLILVREFKVALSDYAGLPIAADVHVQRVFYRLGLCRKDADPDEVVDRARSLHPEFPGILDTGAWEIGRTWCRPKNPRCSECFMHEVCPTAAHQL